MSNEERHDLSLTQVGTTAGLHLTNANSLTETATLKHVQSVRSRVFEYLVGDVHSSTWVSTFSDSWLNDHVSGETMRTDMESL